MQFTITALALAATTIYASPMDTSTDSTVAMLQKIFSVEHKQPSVDLCWKGHHAGPEPKRASCGPHQQAFDGACYHECK